MATNQDNPFITIVGLAVMGLIAYYVIQLINEPKPTQVVLLQTTQRPSGPGPFHLPEPQTIRYIPQWMSIPDNWSWWGPRRWGPEPGPHPIPPMPHRPWPHPIGNKPFVPPQPQPLPHAFGGYEA